MWDGLNEAVRGTTQEEDRYALYESTIRREPPEHVLRSLAILPILTQLQSHQRLAILWRRIVEAYAR